MHLERLQAHLHVINVLNIFQILYLFHPLGVKCCRPVTVFQVPPVGLWWLTNPNPLLTHSDFRMLCANWRHLFSRSIIVQICLCQILHIQMLKKKKKHLLAVKLKICNEAAGSNFCTTRWTNRYSKPYAPSFKHLIHWTHTEHRLVEA